MWNFLPVHALDLLGTLVGLVYIYQEYKASIYLWITGIIMPAIYIFVYWEAGLYADFGMSVYYVLAAAYGFLSWKFLKKKDTVVAGERPITHFPKRLILPSVLVFAMLWGAIYWVLAQFTNSTVPIFDSWGNALSIIGLWALAKKYLEQWYIWIAVDAELSILYVYKELPFTGVLYALYVVIAIAGVFKWRKIMKEQQPNLSL